MPTISDFLKNIPGIKADESKKKIVLAYLLGLLFISIAYIVFFLRPTSAALVNLFFKTRARKIEIKSVRDDLPLKDKFLEKRRLQEEKLARFGKKLSREKELPQLLENLSKVARGLRVRILGITPLDSVLATRKKGAKKKGKIYQEIPIRISAQSGYHELGSFINKLENNQRYMQVSDLKIRPNRTNPKRHSVEFVVYAYTFKQK